jgi:GNAT superfamily N-acetyltransferase
LASGEGLRIAPLRPSDHAAWRVLWDAYLRFYGAELPSATTDATWKRLNDPSEPMFAFGAFSDGRLTGIAHYLFHRSCWSIADYCYLQDLYVDASARRQGTGRALIEAVESAARHAGAGRIYWLTKEDNTRARALYDRLAERSGFIQYRKIF